MELSLTIKRNAAATGAPESSRPQQMWNILRGPQGRSGVNARELAMLASTAETAISEYAARTYLAALCARGIARRKPDGRYWVPRLKLSGALAPRILRVEVLYDPNEGTIAKGPYAAREVGP